MNIGTAIKKIRRERDITQEVLAEHLGVSISAVSQWESNKTSPDLSLIPALCNFLNISSDELLGIHNNEQKIYEIRKNAEKYSSKGYKKESYAILKNGLNEFPNSYGIMYDIMHETLFLKDLTEYTAEERNQFLDETIRLAERIYKGCLNDNYRYGAISILCDIYARNGNSDRAMKLALSMPTMVSSREFLFTKIFSSTEGFKCDQNLIYRLIQFISERMARTNRKNADGKMVYTEDELAFLCDKEIAMFDLLFEKKDFLFFNSELAMLHSNQANYYAKQNNTEKTLSHLTKAADHAIAFIQYTRKGTLKHTSLLLRGYETNGSGFISCDSENDALLLLEKMNSDCFDFIRETDEFSAIANKLKRFAEKWQIE